MKKDQQFTYGLVISLNDDDRRILKELQDTDSKLKGYSVSISSVLRDCFIFLWLYYRDMQTLCPEIMEEEHPKKNEKCKHRVAVYFMEYYKNMYIEDLKKILGCRSYAEVMRKAIRCVYTMRERVLNEKDNVPT